MICSKCGKENKDGAIICGSCGDQLILQAQLTSEVLDKPQNTTQGLRKMSVVLVIFLTIITAEIYCPIWFLKRIEAINSLKSKEKLQPNIFRILGFLFSLCLIFNIVSFIKFGRGSAFSTLFSIIGWIILVVQSFKVRRIFNEHFNVQMKKQIHFSWTATFFFYIWYLQYKINNLSSIVEDTSINA